MGSVQARTARLTSGLRSFERHGAIKEPNIRAFCRDSEDQAGRPPPDIPSPLLSTSARGKNYSVRPDIEVLSVYEPSDLPEVTEEFVEVERPVWVALVQLTQLLSPDLAEELVPALRAGCYPILGISVSQAAHEALSHMMMLVWGSIPVVIPIVRQVSFSIDSNGLPCPGKTYEQIRLSPHLPVSVQLIEVSSCSPIERRILNAKQAYSRSNPSEVVSLGVAVAMGAMSLPKETQTSEVSSGRPSSIKHPTSSLVSGWIRTKTRR